MCLTDLLSKLTVSNPKVRQQRRDSLLKPAEAISPESWKMCVPPAFDDALDIRLTQRIETRDGKKRTVAVWTQGSAFAFDAGDVLYDSSAEYEVESGGTAKAKLCLQVMEARPARSASKDAPRDAGWVRLRVMGRSAEATKWTETGRVELTQDELVRFCIEGESESIRSACDDMEL